MDEWEDRMGNSGKKKKGGRTERKEEGREIQNKSMVSMNI